LSLSWLRAALRGMATSVAVVLTLCPPASALPPALESGDCSLEGTTPATVMSIGLDGGGDPELVLDDGRRASLAGLDFSSRGPMAQTLLTRWLAGRLVFVRAATLDRWGRAPAQIFAAATPASASPLIAVGGAVLEAGLARYLVRTRRRSPAGRFISLWRTPHERPMRGYGPMQACSLSM
jgi:hypothetical protein